jgi:Recombinase zinc beta ribbon domain
MEEWKVCIPEHHPGYVTWEQYLATQARLRANIRPRGEGGGAAREGSALLQGLLRCGKCGRKMMVTYSGIHGRTHTYQCSRIHQMQATRRPCQTIGGLRLDSTVVDAFLEAVNPAGVDATAAAVDQLEVEHAERQRLQALALERAEFEAGRRRRQFDACERRTGSSPARSRRLRTRARRNRTATPARRAGPASPRAADRDRTSRAAAPGRRTAPGVEREEHQRSGSKGAVSRAA